MAFPTLPPGKTPVPPCPSKDHVFLPILKETARIFKGQEIEATCQKCGLVVKVKTEKLPLIT